MRFETEPARSMKLVWVELTVEKVENQYCGAGGKGLGGNEKGRRRAPWNIDSKRGVVDTICNWAKTEADLQNDYVQATQ